jgi:hypothetical protein
VWTVLDGCGSDRLRLYAGADARRLAAIQPRLAGWSWPPSNARPVWDTSRETATTDPLLRRFIRQTAKLVELGGASNRWQDTNKLANLDIEVFQDSTDAHAVMAPFNALSEAWAKQTGRVTKAGQTTGLGDEAWVMQVVGNGPQVTYHWRRGNLVFEAHIQCFGRCPPNVDRAAQAWAAAIDTAARQKP